LAQVAISGKVIFIEGTLESVGAVVRNGKWGYIDKSGKEVIPAQFDHALNFRDCSKSSTNIYELRTPIEFAE